MNQIINNICQTCGHAFDIESEFDRCRCGNVSVKYEMNPKGTKEKLNKAIEEIGRLMLAKNKTERMK